MPKKSRSFTLDESVYEELQARNDLNASGIVNDFLKRYLRGEETDKAAEKLRAERLEEEASELVEEAQSKKEQAQRILSRLEEERKEREELWEEAVEKVAPDDSGLRSVNIEPGEYHPNPDDPNVEHWSDEIGISNKEFCERFPDKHAKFSSGGGGSDRTFQ